MKPFSIIQGMRARGQKLRTPMVLLYLFLGMAAAWHNHPDAHPSSELTLQASTTNPAANPAVHDDAFCALCSWQSLQQDAATATVAVMVVTPLAEAPNLPVIFAPAPGFSQAHLARGPPSV